MVDHLDTADGDPVQGWFKVYQDGIEVAGGYGPYEAIKREAAHYAAVYGQDGPVKVRVQRVGKRKP